MMEGIEWVAVHSHPLDGAGDDEMTSCVIFDRGRRERGGIQTIKGKNKTNEQMES
jgi:hypothetical protein